MEIRFSDFAFDVDRGELLKDGIPVHLQPQPTKVLCLLASHPGRLVTREEIREEVWESQTFVDFEQGLNTCIRQIRAALDDSPETPRFVETVPRRGYRFIATLSTSAASPDAGPAEATAAPILAGSRWHLGLWFGLVIVALLVTIGFYAAVHYGDVPATQKSGRVMLAVLPFEDLSSGADEQSFSDGLTEELIAQIGGMEPNKLGVIARTSAMQYRRTSKSVAQIGDELGVSYVLEGSVRWEGSHVRIVAKLIQANDQTPLWSKMFESDTRNLIALQNQVALHVARTLALKLLPSEPELLARITTPVPDAYEDYSHARQVARQGTTQGLQESIPLYEAAIQHDPNYAIAYAGLADTYLTLSDRRTISPQRAFPRTEEAVREVLALDPSYAEGYIVLAAIRAFYDWEWKDAGYHFRRAMEHNADNPRAHLIYARYLRALGRWDQALAQLQAAEKLDPGSTVVALNLAVHHYYARQPDRTLELARKVLAADPQSEAARRLLGIAFEQKGEPEKALPLLQEAVSLSGNNSMYLGALGHAYALAGRTSEARKILKQMTEAKADYMSAYDIALIHLGLGDTDSALKSLQKAVDERALNLRYLNIDPRFDNLRADPRFQAIVQRIGFDR